MGGSEVRTRTVAAYPISGGKSSKMQRTVESVNPVLRKRTPKDSTALATAQESNWRNFSSAAGSIWFEVIGSPDLKIPYKFREHQGRIHAGRHITGAAG